MVSRREMAGAVAKLVKAGVARLDTGHGERDAAVTDPFGRPLEWVDIGGAMWDEHCAGIIAPWRYRGPMDAPAVDEINAVWDVLELAGARNCHPRGIELRYPKERGVVLTALLQRPVPRSGRYALRAPEDAVAAGLARGLAFAGLGRR